MKPTNGANPRQRHQSDRERHEVLSAMFASPKLPQHVQPTTNRIMRHIAHRQRRSAK